MKLLIDIICWLGDEGYLEYVGKALLIIAIIIALSNLIEIK